MEMVWVCLLFADPNVLQLEDPDCEDGSSAACESVFSLNAEKILVSVGV